MSISLNVVKAAVVFCASLRRSAIRNRIRFIFTRRSPSPGDPDTMDSITGFGVSAGLEAMPLAVEISDFFGSVFLAGAGCVDGAAAGVEGSAEAFAGGALAA